MSRISYTEQFLMLANVRLAPICGNEHCTTINIRPQDLISTHENGVPILLIPFLLYSFTSDISISTRQWSIYSHQSLQVSI